MEASVGNTGGLIEESVANLIRNASGKGIRVISISSFEMDEGKHHDHMVCVETGDVVEFVNEEIERLQQEIVAKHNYELIDHNLVLYVRPLPDKSDES